VSQPSVSVCIPTYNGAHYLRDCLDSALDQTYGNIEILVVDDASTDETLSIAAIYAERDGRVRLVRNEQRYGLIRNWNRCVHFARGEWIKFLFQDDLLDPTCLDAMIAASRGVNIPLVACRRRTIFEGVSDGTLDEYAKLLSKGNSVFPGRTKISPEEFREAVLDHPGMNFIGEPTAVLLHRSVFERFGQFNPHFVEIGDLEFWTRVGVNVGLRVVPRALATFRVHPGAASAVNRRERRYRREQLDQLILFHEFAFHPAFAPLRAAAAHRQPPIRLARRFAVLSLRARDLAEVEPDGTTPKDGRDLLEWRAIAATYPRLERALPVRMLRCWRVLQRVSRTVVR
jgi:glycosyltransferase involved in cell wall biosynthesis